MNGRYFLATLTVFTTFISLLNYHILDMGGLIKLLYTIDSYSYSNYQINDNKKLKLINNKQANLKLENYKSEEPSKPKKKFNKTGGQSIYNTLYNSLNYK